MIQINLIPDVKLDLIRIQKHRNLVISMAILAMMVTLARGILCLWRSDYTR